MVYASHVIFCAYGFWLPNDPRGSWSDFVGAWELLRFGRASKVTTRRSLARDEHDRELRLAAKRALKYPPVGFTGEQMRAVAQGFARAVAKTDLCVWACSILPEHVHMVLARHRHDVERLVIFFKAEATKELCRRGLHPLAAFAADRALPPKAWGRGLWKVFLDSYAHVRNAVDYVRDNPLKEGKSEQQWPFVQTFDGIH